MFRRFDTPGLFSGSNLISPSESVVALMMDFLILLSASRRDILECSFSADLLILASGSSRAIILAPDFMNLPSGTTKVSPYLLFTLIAMSLVSSMCCFWSFPTGTTSVSYNSMSAAMRTGYVRSPVPTDSLPPLLALNWVILKSSPVYELQQRTHPSSACPDTWD